MTDFLVRKFIRDHENTGDIGVRESYGTLSSVTGIVCNVLLFVIKFAAGTFSGSVSIVSDAFNNLSDSASCIVTLIGYKLSAKPADKDHPFGHGRMEYLTSLIIAVFIFLVGFELLKSSADRIIHPEEVIFSIAALISLVASIALKLWMAAFNTKLGNKINSPVMIASARDSRNDVIATGAALVGLLASLFTTLPADGVMGIVVSVFILKAGFEIVKDTVDDLLGKPADKELVEQIQQLVTDDERILGVHDLVVHDYGPGRMFASCHAEVSSSEDFTEIHEIIDNTERRIMEEKGIMMTIHMDPIDTDNKEVAALREKIEGFIKGLDNGLKLHDFRMVFGERDTNVIFDVVMPYDCAVTEREIKEKTAAYINSGSDMTYHLVITIDREY